MTTSAIVTADLHKTAKAKKLLKFTVSIKVLEESTISEISNSPQSIVYDKLMEVSLSKKNSSIHFNRTPANDSQDTGPYCGRSVWI